ncbi:PQQ-dependent sugar dehydrogenase [Haloferula sp. BvORR071]|uniref:PQQ-dependent sugar dehydrogenase n=1 Tax=Haloferula sp. BvORR071 TaxID=1396141 RepID=UPI00069862BA|nr:PQQ-dependent sugar dehydrogenase [Haloferula sp. BvORR071]
MGTLPRPFLPLLAALLPLAGGASVDAASLPTGFAETQIAKDLNPTTMTFAPDGRLLLCEKHGLLRVVADGAMLPAPVLDLSAKIDAWNERGLLSVCFDPDFARNGWIYIYYTLNRDPKDTKHESSNNRVSRFTLKGNVADPKSEQVILELNPLSKTGWHNGGGLAFGKDGKLYVSTGENANGGYAQDNSNLLGKLLRINKDGSIPKDNPHYQEFKDQNRAIVALGLRNPFSIAAQRNTGLLYVCMVGANYEQIEAYDSAAAPLAVNYGWPNIDGPPKNQPQPPGYRAPTYAYDHGRGDGVALCSGDFYNPAKPGADAFPPEYTGRFFFSDYKGWIKAIDPAKPETRYDFATKIDRPIDVEVAPDGALWYIERAGKPGGSDESNSSSSNGSLWRVRWTGGGQATQLAVIQQPTNTHVGSPLGTVTVALQDATGNTVSSANNTISLTLDGNAPATLAGTTKVDAVKGVANFSSLAIAKPGRGYKLRASSGSLGTVSSAAFDVDEQLEAPTITPPAGSFSGPVWVRISSPVPSATLRFTTDGKDPDASSTVYKEPFQISAGQTIKAIAQRNGVADSGVANAKIEVSGNTPYGLDTRPPVSGLKLPATEAEGLPPTLSATGIFTDKKLTARAGIIPYSLNAPSWTDNAEVQRWVALPESARIGFSPTGEYQWPGGTVFIQHFEMVTNPASNARRRLETRVLVLDGSGSFGYGATYRWRADQSDADLVDAGGQEEVLKITDASGANREQTWSYPARGLCFMCHTPNAGFVLGPKTRQLNGTQVYAGGRSDNQLRTWNYLQMFSPGVDESAIKGYAHTVKIDDAAAPLEERVRSYLDANCSSCHRPNGTGALWDARFDTPLAKQNIINRELRESMGIANVKVVTPGDPATSMMHLRMSSSTLGQQMPPVGRTVVDKTALEVLSQWIKASAGK